MDEVLHIYILRWTSLIKIESYCGKILLRVIYTQSWVVVLVLVATITTNLNYTLYHGRWSRKRYALAL